METGLEHNISMRDEIEKEHGMKLREYAKTKWGAYFSRTFRCVEKGCTKHLPFPILQFYNWDITKVKCYEHQGLAKKLI